MGCLGLPLVAIGVGLWWLARDSEGIGRQFALFLALVLCAMGVWLAFFETGEGLGRFIPALAPGN